MINFLLLLVCISLSVALFNDTRKLAIVYVFTVVPKVCHYGLPEYIKVSLEQAISQQPDCDIILVSNYADCENIAIVADTVNYLMRTDTTLIESNRTRNFRNISERMFMKDNDNELWLTSALRFLLIEDFMIALNYHELIHVEADNMIYGQMTDILDILRTGYKGLAATPLTAQLTYITASVMWIYSKEAIVHFNDYLIALGTNKDSTWTDYCNYLKKSFKGKIGGKEPDKNGIGIKPFSINEMTMMAYYKRIYPKRFFVFPVVPNYHYYYNRYTINMSNFSPGGKEVGPDTGSGIWDPNSWGQYLGGTADTRGRNKGFRDPTHIAGQAIRLNTNCTPVIICSNKTLPIRPVVNFSTPLNEFSPKPNKTSRILIEKIDLDNNASKMLYGFNESNLIPVMNRKGVNDTIRIKNRTLDQIADDIVGGNGSHDNNEFKCYTAPYVRCSESDSWTPLWNLHVHSKHTSEFKSLLCSCP